MTIIISYLTHNYVVQVSDRRVSFLDSSNRIVQRDDIRNKAVYLLRKIAFGYTGLAEIEKGLRTDSWLTNVLTNLPSQSIDVAAEKIRASATECLRKRLDVNLEQKRLAFVGVGWAIPFNEEALCPIFVNISNFHEKSGNPLPVSNDEFTVGYKFLDITELGASNITGYPLPPKIKTELKRELRMYSRKGVGPRLVINLLATTIRNARSVHSEFREYVGDNLMALVIPKLAVESKSPFYVSGIPSLENDTFVYLPAGIESEISYMPNVVSGMNSATGGRILTGETARREEEKLPTAKSPRTIVLTKWAGSGTLGDPRHPAVADSYSLKGYYDLTGLESWPSNAPCPYYGLVVGIDAAEEIIQSIADDKNFMLIISDANRFEDIPSSEWLSDLQVWLLKRGMEEIASDNFTRRINGFNRGAIIQELINLLKTS